MMELDELKQKWAERDRKLDVGIRIARQLLTAQRIAVGIAAPGRFLNRGVRHRACRHYPTRLLYRRPHCNVAVCGACRGP